MAARRVCVSDFEEEAKKVLPKAVYDYYRSGADEENTLTDNVAAFDRYILHTQNYHLHGNFKCFIVHFNVLIQVANI